MQNYNLNNGIFPIFCRSDRYKTLETPDIIIGIAKSYTVHNFINIYICLLEQILGHINSIIHQILIRTHSGIRLKKSYEMVFAKVSAERNKSFAEQLATVSDKTPVGKIFGDITHRVSRNGKKFRGPDVTGKDRELLRAISDPAFNAGAITNKALLEKLIGTDWANGLTGKKLSSKISRQISLLRSHGIIRKLPKQNKYALTEKGRKISSALNAVLSASTEDLVNLVA